MFDAEADGKNAQSAIDKVLKECRLFTKRRGCREKEKSCRMADES